jgi:hypothetical protein
MKRDPKKSFAKAFFILLFMPIVIAAGQPQGSPSPVDVMSVWQARRAIVTGLTRADAEVSHHDGSIDRGSIRLSSGAVQFDVSGPALDTRHYTVDFKAVESVSSKCTPAVCFLENAAGKRFHKNRPGAALGFLFWFDPDSESRGLTGSAECRQTAASFAAAFNRLHALADDNGAALAKFREQAAAWRALPSKPPVPEAVREQRLLAEDALKQRQLEEALNHYEDGLKLDPTWPQGHYDAALIAAQLGVYAEAVEQMQEYLELVPHASDAQAARDQIVIWQYKANQSR